MGFIKVRVVALSAVFTALQAILYPLFGNIPTYSTQQQSAQCNQRAVWSPCFAIVSRFGSRTSISRSRYTRSPASPCFDQTSSTAIPSSVLCTAVTSPHCWLQLLAEQVECACRPVQQTGEGTQRAARLFCFQDFGVANLRSAGTSPTTRVWIGV